MIRSGEGVFVDTGAWIALAVIRDPLHPRARAAWEELLVRGARLKTSVPVVLETFTFMDRKISRALAQRWRQSLATVPRLSLFGCTSDDVEAAYPLLDDRRMHRLGLVDATSFVLMRKHKIRAAFAFDTHFATAGFRCLG